MIALRLIILTFFFLILFPLILQPLRLGLVILVATLFICLLSAVQVSSWYGYILFLIYVGGLLVIFAYVAALIPNLLFNEPKNPLYLYIILIAVLMYYIYAPDFGALSFINMSFNNGAKLERMGLMTLGLISIYISLAIILLLTLVIIVKICYSYHSSLRPYK
jgi:NADH-ubiquinone oxidoreductase chain 6